MREFEGVMSRFGGAGGEWERYGRGMGELIFVLTCGGGTGGGITYPEYVHKRQWCDIKKYHLHTTT